MIGYIAVIFIFAFGVLVGYLICQKKKTDSSIGHVYYHANDKHTTYLCFIEQEHGKVYSIVLKKDWLERKWKRIHRTEVIDNDLYRSRPIAE